MNGRVPLARRSLFQDRRRTALATGGVAAALLLVLLLQGIFDGAMERVTTYIRSSPADVVVSEQNVKTMHMSVSTLDASTTADIRRVPGVAWAAAIRYTTTFLASDTRAQQLSYVIGYDTSTGRGGPPTMTEGRPPKTGDVALEWIAADRLGVDVGDRITIFGAGYRVSGLFHGGTTIVNSIAFITTDDFAAKRGGSVSYVLVGAEPGTSATELSKRIEAEVPKVTVQTRDQFAGEEAALVRDMSADLMRIMSLIGLLIALAVVGLTLFTLTLSKLREHAITKALGARTTRLAAIVLAQALWSVLLAVLTATAMAIVIGRIVGRVNPAIYISIQPSSVLRVAIATVVIGGLASIVPIRRVATVDPASAFRSAS